MFILVIAYGNTLRRDDGAGVALARKLVRHWRKLGIAAQQLAVTQLTPELAAEIANIAAAMVIFVDTSAANTAGIEVRALDLDTPSPSLGHHLDPATLILYARLLYGYRAPAWVITIAGTDFGHGEGFSPQVEKLLANAPAVAAQIGANRELAHA
jgi:hydrogenase maturation protease